MMHVRIGTLHSALLHVQCGSDIRLWQLYWRCYAIVLLHSFQQNTTC